MLRLVLATLAIVMVPLIGRAQEFDQYSQPWQAGDIAQSPITFTVGADSHYKVNDYKHGVSDQKLKEGSYITSNFSGYFLFADAERTKGSAYFLHGEPSEWIRRLSGFFNKGARVDVRDHGWLSLSQQVEYSLFSYPFDKPRDCAAYDVRVHGFALGGILCAPPGSTLAKADLQRLIGAIGYPGFLTPTPLASAP